MAKALTIAFHIMLVADLVFRSFISFQCFFNKWFFKTSFSSTYPFHIFSFVKEVPVKFPSISRSLFWLARLFQFRFSFKSSTFLNF